MNKINFKQPKYIIPAIAFFPVMFIGYMVIEMGNFERPQEEGFALNEMEELNLSVQDAALEKRTQHDKLDALRSAFQKSSDFSGIAAIDREDEAAPIDGGAGSLYTMDEMRTIDSLNQVSRMKEGEMRVQQERYMYGDFSSPAATGADTEATRPAPEKSRMEEGMELFKMQMAFLDSLQNPQPRTPEAPVRQEVDPAERPIEVLKADNPAARYFNTLGAKQTGSLITAILDETVKVQDGHRLKIRLLDDIIIDGGIITKGSYLYGNVTGFKAQRILANITSILVDGRLLKVDLSVYDTDHQEGFYIPASKFRDLTKEIGGQIQSQSIQFDQQSQGLEQVAYGALQDIYRSSSQAISKNIRQNKGTLKYGSHIYLINNKELK